MLERFKRKDMENLLELHNKTPVWNDGKSSSTKYMKSLFAKTDKSIFVNFKYGHHRIIQKIIFKMIPRSLHIKNYFWSYDQKYQKFSSYFLYISAASIANISIWQKWTYRFLRTNSSYIHWASKETYHFFRATLTKIHVININNIWAEINFNTPQ